MDGLNAFACNYGVTILYYPMRDWVKGSGFTYQQKVNFKYLSVRYQGMIFNPSFPTLLSVPMACMVQSYHWVLAATGSTFVSAQIGALMFSVAKVMVATYARRIGSSTQGMKAKPLYNNMAECLRASTARYGVWSWLAGGSVVISANALWYGMTLYQLARVQPIVQQGFTEDFFISWQTHAMWAFVSAPIRNGWRTARAVTDRTPLRSWSDFVAHEKGVFTEGKNVVNSMVKEQGPIYLVRGTLRTWMKTSLPFALTYSSYRLFGGSLHRRIGEFRDANKANSHYSRLRHE